MRICRRETFNAAHRLFVEHWTNEQNFAVFGKCSNPNFHGHNYILETCIDGEINEETGYVFDLVALKEIVRSEVCERFDHRNLNLDCPEFYGKNPTSENIIIVIWNLLRKKIPMHLSLSLRLWETENHWVEYDGK